MEVVFMRHANALSASAAGVSSDNDRPLSESGMIEARETAELLIKAGFLPSAIITSPLKRAKQTAEQAAAVFSGAPVLDDPALASPGDPAALSKGLVSAATGHLLVIGHHPAIGMMPTPFLGKVFSFSTAGFLRLDLSPDGKASVLDSRGCEEL